MTDDLDEPIVELYEASLDPRRLGDAVASLCRALGTHALWSQVRRPSGEPLEPFALHGLTEDAVGDYAAHYWRSNPVTHPMLTSPHNRVRDLHRVLERGVIERSEMYQDWALPHGLAHTFGWRGDAGTEHVLAVSIGFDAAPAGRSKVMARIQRIAPHLTHAARLRFALGDARREARRLRDIVESLRCATFLLDGDARVSEANDAGRAMLLDATILRSEGRRLCAVDRVTDRRLKATIGRVVERRAAAPVHLGPATPVTPVAYVLPREGIGDGRPPGAVVLVPPAAGAGTALEDWLHVTYGCTPAEAQVALALSRGEDLRAIAEAREVALGTVRNQLKRAMQKTRTRRQPELVALILRTAGPLFAFFSVSLRGPDGT